MNNKLRALRGTKDLLPRDFSRHEHIINKAQKMGALYGYEPMSTPIIEYTHVFDRSLGDTSDVVSKEMYSFLDRSNDSISLRPEFTASVMRAFISNGLHHKLPLKFFSFGPAFRSDRPQAGRQRQFHQLNFEYIGAEGPHTDVETIKLAVDLLDCLGISEYATLEINSLGCEESRKIYHKKLVEYFADYNANLSEDSRRRLEKNPLRILDSKDENDRMIVKNAPLMSEYYTDLARKYFDTVLEYLTLLKIKYVVNERLVRGLDYYCHTAFEFTSNKLGSQSSILGGGRYDGLAKLMNGPDTPAFGFAAGIERIAMIMDYEATKTRPTFIMNIGDDLIGYSLMTADKLRQQGIQVILDTKGKVQKRMQRAVEQNVKHIIFIGQDEKNENKFQLKDLDAKQEKSVDFEQLVNLLKT